MRYWLSIWRWSFYDTVIPKSVKWYGNWWIKKDEKGGDFGQVHALPLRLSWIDEIYEYMGQYSWWLDQDSRAKYDEHISIALRLYQSAES